MQMMKGKYEKMERTVSQAALNNKELKEKVNTLENTIAELKKNEKSLS